MLRRLVSTNALPAALALQGLSFVLLAFFLQAVRREGSTHANRSAGRGGDATAMSAPADIFQVPRDLEPRRLPVPKLPEFDRPLEDEAPLPENEGSTATREPEVREPRLAGSRVQSIALAALVPLSAAAPLPGAPDSIEPHSIDGRSWLAGTRRARRGFGGARGPSDVGDGDGGWGGTGIGGSGGGSGGYCPTPRGVGGGRGGRGRPGGTTAGPSGVSNGSGGGGSGSGGAPEGSGPGRPAGGKGGSGRGKGKSK